MIASTKFVKMVLDLNLETHANRQHAPKQGTLHLQLSSDGASPCKGEYN